jgi:1-deoxy-D-xylulose-5-phosphate synthase
MAGGLAKQGMIPVCAVYSTFIQRAYDMLFHDVCLPNLHVVFAIDRAGLVPDDGQTHQGIYDIGIFMQMPNITILCPSATSELDDMLNYATYELKGPVVIRYPKTGNNKYPSKGPLYEPQMIKTGDDIAIVTYGRLTENAAEAANLLDNKGINTAVIKLTQINPLDIKDLLKLAGNVKSIYVAEECVSSGSLASKLALELPDHGFNGKITALNLGNKTIPSASLEELMSLCKLDAKGIKESIMEKEK